MKLIKYLSGAVFVIGLFMSWGIVGALDCGDGSVSLLLLVFATTIGAGLAWLATSSVERERK